MFFGFSNEWKISKVVHKLGDDLLGKMSIAFSLDAFLENDLVDLLV